MLIPLVDYLRCSNCSLWYSFPHCPQFKYDRAGFHPNTHFPSPYSQNKISQFTITISLLVHPSANVRDPNHDAPSASCSRASLWRQLAGSLHKCGPLVLLQHAHLASTRSSMNQLHRAQSGLIGVATISSGTNTTHTKPSFTHTVCLFDVNFSPYLV
ncbi:hypothetical protein EG68_02831 [Paragonimus skrjabini miyazakii]|uniref:Uncharacterized protein n=1 Tax=Paragonimus skrjabini miyazakii TaxID=59628 RepID=A0A8S9ZAR4_9TREM|nr:hypothetical protein EG68_02831 [Paragonimus skrjabini miyazakii]